MKIRIIQLLLLLLLSLPFAILLLPTHALADGGAPNLAYVSGTAQGVSIIDIGQQKVIDRVALPGVSGALLLSIDGRLLSLSQPTSGRVTILATKTKQVLCSSDLPGHPSLLALDPGTNTLYVAGADSRQVTALDPMTCEKKYTIEGKGPVSGLVVAIVGGGLAGGEGNEIWVASPAGLMVFGSNGSPRASINLPGRPQHLCIPAGTSVYVTTQAGEIDVVDLKTRRYAPLLRSGDTLGPMDYDATTGEIYVPDLSKRQIDVLAPAILNGSGLPHQPRRVISFASVPQAIAITSDGQLGFVALEDGNVAELDIPGHQMIATFHVGGQPSFVITGLYPSTLNFTPQQWLLTTFLSNALHYLAAGVIILTPLIALALQRYRARRRSLSS